MDWAKKALMAMFQTDDPSDLLNRKFKFTVIIGAERIDWGTITGLSITSRDILMNTTVGRFRYQWQDGKHQWQTIRNIELVEPPEYARQTDTGTVELL